MNRTAVSARAGNTTTTPNTRTVNTGAKNTVNAPNTRTANTANTRTVNTGNTGNTANTGAKNTGAKNTANTPTNIIAFLFGLQVAVKMFHWQTSSYAAHVETGKLFDTIVEVTDELIEQYMGVYGRPRIAPGTTVAVSNMTAETMSQTLRDGIDYLNRRLPRDSHIQNLRDELTGHMATALYLLTMQ